MKIRLFDQSTVEECDSLWWSIYEHKPYVHRPDGCQTVNTKSIGPGYFAEHLNYGLEGAAYWPDGSVSEDSIFLVENGGRIRGIVICSIDSEKGAGYICSAYVRWNEEGRACSELLVEAALNRFRDFGLKVAVAAPQPRGKSMEVECPFHLGLLDARFAWKSSWFEPEQNGISLLKYTDGVGVYGVFQGGSLQGFEVTDPVHRRVEELGRQGFRIETWPAQRFHETCRADPADKPTSPNSLNLGVNIVALEDGNLIGWMKELCVWDDDCGKTGGAVPFVDPEYRRMGIGKAIYQFAMQEAVRHGADWGWTATEIHHPARFIYQSVGYRYWYTSYTQWERPLST